MASAEPRARESNFHSTILASTSTAPVILPNIDPTLSFPMKEKGGGEIIIQTPYSLNPINLVRDTLFDFAPTNKKEAGKH